MPDTQVHPESATPVRRGARAVPVPSSGMAAAWSAAAVTVPHAVGLGLLAFAPLAADHSLAALALWSAALPGLLLTLAAPLALVIGGIALLTFGFFGAHAVASGWVGRRAQRAKGQAAALYLLAYYLGSSLVGTTGGKLYAPWGWAGVVGIVMACMMCALATAAWLWRRVPLPPGAKR